MFDEVDEASDAIEIAQGAANRHGTAFYVVTNQPLPGGSVLLRVTSNPPTGDYLERIDPVYR